MDGQRKAFRMMSVDTNSPVDRLFSTRCCNVDENSPFVPIICESAAARLLREGPCHQIQRRRLGGETLALNSRALVAASVSTI
jgi:hypothetical protein